MAKEMVGSPAPERRKTTIGGQALIEGLLMIGPEKTVMATLMPGGQIDLHTLPDNAGKSCRIPLLRGAINIFRQLVTGTKAMMRSAEIQEAAETENTEASPEASELTDVDSLKPKREKGASEQKKSSGTLMLYLSLLLGLGLGIALFILLPNLITTGLIALTGMTRYGYGATLLYNLLEGVIRIAILILYMWLCSLQKDIARVWQFHGAEHKTIACYEACWELTPDNVQRFSRFHPRCGTSFIFIVVFMAAIIFSLVGWYGLWLNLLIRLALLPLIAGLSYELLRYSGRHSDKWLGRALARPGLWLQRLTTKEPDRKMLEVAIAAMNAVTPQECQADAWS